MTAPDNVPVAADRGARWYRLADEPRSDLSPRLHRHGIPGIGANLFEVTLAAGVAFPLHHHPQEQITYVISGLLRLSFQDGSGPFDVGPGEAVNIPGGCAHAVEALADTLLIDIYAPARNDILPAEGG